MSESAPAVAESGLCRFPIPDTRLSALTMGQTVEAVLGWVERRERRYVNVFAVESLLKCRDDAKLARIVNEADLVLTDGMPLVWIGRHIAGLKLERCYGPDVMIEVMAAGCASGVRHYLYGGADETILDRLENRLYELFPDIIIAGRHVPPHRPLTEEEEEAVVENIHASRADIVWVGIGTPKQDYWVGEFRQRLETPALLAVGAAFNFHAGTVSQAPRWMMRSGLEWLYRLLAEPRRLWRRYLIGNPRFIFLVLRQWLTRKPVPLGKVFTDHDR